MPLSSEMRPPDPEGITVTYVSPGGVACRPFADGYLTMRVCLGHIQHGEDGLQTEVARRRDPVPWASKKVRKEAIAELGRRVEGAEGVDQAGLVRLLEHVRRTPYYDSG